MRILIVDDSPFIVAHVRALVPTLMGDASLQEASTLQGVQDALRNGPFDLALVDVLLKNGERGVDALTLIMARAPGATAVVRTALQREHPDVTAALSLGAHAYLQKPFTPSELRHVLDHLDLPGQATPQRRAFGRLRDAHDAPADGKAHDGA